MSDDKSATLFKDLELTIQETPGMTAALPWRVFKLNDYEWWVARTLDEAKADYLKFTGVSEEEGFDDPHELDGDTLDKLTFIEDPEVAQKDMVKRSFREELDRLVRSGLDRPQIFACTEY